MQQHRPGPAGRRAQVQRERLLQRVQLQPHGPGLGPQIRFQRHRGCRVRYRPEQFADHQITGDEPGRVLVTVAQHRLGGLAHLGQAGQRAAAQRGQRIGQPGRLDDVRGGHRQVVCPEYAGHPGQPADDGVLAGAEQVVVPARRGDPGAVAGRRGQPGMRPRHPGQGGFPFRQAAQHGGIGGGGRELPGQRRGVPGPADHGDRPVLAGPGGVPQRGPQHLAHVCLAALLIRLLGRRGRGRGAYLGHRLGQRGEWGLPVHPGLDQVIPPALRVVIAGRGGQHGYRVPLRPGRLPGRPPSASAASPAAGSSPPGRARPRLASSTEAGRSQNRTGT